MVDASAYSSLDRLTHRVAFSHRVVQDVLAEVEAAAFGRSWRHQPLVRPIFVTSLPRAGTTLLLQLLSRLGAVATHTYRDMPFVRAPLLWSRLSGRFRAARGATERAHGDGVMVGFDSPEAFEETLWLARFPAHYQERGIRLWHEPAPGFTAELADHMRRIMVLRRGEAGETARYLSKNNANIARIPLLRAAFPDAQMLVPIRDPLAQAHSMHRQHLRFAALHAKDRFARRYMADIGHFEFGALHRPILFDGMDELALRHVPDRLEYWLGYWVRAYRHLARQQGITFLDYARFCREGSRHFRRLCEEIGVTPDPAAARQAAQQIKPAPVPAQPDRAPEGLDEARELFDELSARSLPAVYTRAH